MMVRKHQTHGPHIPCLGRVWRTTVRAGTVCKEVSFSTGSLLQLVTDTLYYLWPPGIAVAVGHACSLASEGQARPQI